uniref:ERIC3 protein n=1 Tax=Hydatigena taeniaeformis TaxID=6205 RepID=A0A0R3X379_HYDTA
LLGNGYRTESRCSSPCSLDEGQSILVDEYDVSGCVCSPSDLRHEILPSQQLQIYRSCRAHLLNESGRRMWKGKLEFIDYGLLYRYFEKRNMAKLMRWPIAGLRSYGYCKRILPSKQVADVPCKRPPKLVQRWQALMSPYTAVQSGWARQRQRYLSDDYIYLSRTLLQSSAPCSTTPSAGDDYLVAISKFVNTHSYENQHTHVVCRCTDLPDFEDHHQ